MSPVTLKWYTNFGDSLIAELARVSNPANQGNDATAPRLIAYCIRKQHWSIFDMANLCVEINTTRDIGRQMLRHWSMLFHDLKVQEFSQRYADVSALGEPVFREARLQDPKNRQSSTPALDEALQVAWRGTQEGAWQRAGEDYAWALDQGIAKEQARAVLPEGITPTRFYVNGTARQWIHYCTLRMEKGTQKEHREIAEAAWQVFKATFPTTAEAVIEAEVARLDRETDVDLALSKAAKQFRFYEKQHTEKGTAEGAVKAEVNRRMAEDIETLIRRREGQVP